MKCPPLRFGHIQRKNYFNFRDSGASADAPLSHFHGWGRNGKRHLQRLLPAEAAALRGIPSYTTQQGRPAFAGRPCCAYWKGSIGRWQWLFRQTQLFQLAPSTDDLYFGHTLAGRKDALAHVGQQPGLHSPAGCLGGLRLGYIAVNSGCSGFRFACGAPQQHCQLFPGARDGRALGQQVYKDAAVTAS